MNTSIQEAIAKFRDSHNGWSASEITDYLKSLLPKEKEFAEKCFDAGHSDQINKTTFINQLYPEK